MSVQAIQRWVSQLQGGALASQARAHASAVGNGALQVSIGTVVSAGLAAADVYHPNGGLDVTVPGVPERVPLDGVLGATNLLASMIWPQEPFALPLRHVGATCWNVFVFRKTQELLAAKARNAGRTPGYLQRSGTSGVHGEGRPPQFGEDSPIVAVARTL